MKLYFMPQSKIAEHIIDPPLASKRVLPEWYLDTPPYIDNEKTAGIYSDYVNSGVNTTIKKCVPFLDAITYGYVYCLPMDIEIIKNNKEFIIRWRYNHDLISKHSEDQAPLIPSPVNGEKNIFKWNSDFIIKTPPGYSTFFTHPVNRHDLPYRTFSGIVDTDKYFTPVNFPFQLLDLKEKRTIIEKGTPICQFFPIKRDNWQSEIIKFDEEKTIKGNFEIFSKIKNSYKRKFWSKKIFT